MNALANLTYVPIGYVLVHGSLESESTAILPAGGTMEGCHAAIYRSDCNCGAHDVHRNRHDAWDGQRYGQLGTELTPPS